MAKLDFLLSTADVIRAQIKGIEDSYRNPWDILAELSQNAVDAIRLTDKPGKITLEIDSSKKTIQIEDNGNGLSAQDLPRLLNLFASGKKGDPVTNGEKGVGIDFVIFQTSYFEIVSSDGTTASRAIVKDANTWKKQSSDKVIQMDHKEIDISEKPESGTKIIAKGVELSSSDEDEESVSIFKMTQQEIIFLLRTKTALGDTKGIWDKNADQIDITLKLTDINNNSSATSLKNLYWLPTELVAPTELMNIDAFEDWMKKADRSDAQKRAKLQGKVLWVDGEYQHRGYRKINYWACFVPTRGAWDQLNTKAMLGTEEELQNEEWKDYHQTVLFTDGIYTATKGMPTGIAIEPPRSGNAGYWYNAFFIFQDDKLQFDIGRKSIHGNIKKIYQATAKDVFNKITRYVTKYTSSRPAVISVSTFDDYEIRQSVSSLVDLKSSKVSFQKTPADQEAAVSAVFFELIGNKTIDDIEPIYLGYRQKYDLYANIKTDPNGKFKFLEFKSHLNNITKDFADCRKVFDEMDYIICWGVTDRDIQDLKDFGIECEEYTSSTLGLQPVVPKSVTHILSIPNVNPVYVIDLKPLVK